MLVAPVANSLRPQGAKVQAANAGSAVAAVLLRCVYTGTQQRIHTAAGTTKRFLPIRV